MRKHFIVALAVSLLLSLGTTFATAADKPVWKVDYRNADLPKDFVQDNILP